jgi:hypothetical protein
MAGAEYTSLARMPQTDRPPLRTIKAATDCPQIMIDTDAPAVSMSAAWQNLVK